MGFMDKVKTQAEQAIVKAQAGVAQTRARIDTTQAGNQQSDLLRALGAAVYAERRQGGGSDAVDEALAELDDYCATQGPINLTAPPPPTTSMPSAPQPGTPSGDFTL